MRRVAPVDLYSESEFERLCERLDSPAGEARDGVALVRTHDCSGERTDVARVEMSGAETGRVAATPLDRGVYAAYGFWSGDLSIFVQAQASDAAWRSSTLATITAVSVTDWFPTPRAPQESISPPSPLP